MKRMPSSPSWILTFAAALVLAAAAPAGAYTPVPPCLEVTAECSDTGEPGAPILFSGTVTNSCAFPVLGVSVKTFVDSTMVSAVFIGTLEAGASAPYSGSYVPTTCPSTDNVTAYGYFFDATGVKLWPSDYATATCCFVEPPPDGCTLTPGYWKTHSIMGPAPYDDTWALLPDGEATTFYLSGHDYLFVLDRPPRGNAYFILAHAFIAAELNGLAGASMPADVLAAWEQAEALFQAYTPADIADLPNGSALRRTLVGLAEQLDDYNNGFTGPGHCDE